MTPEERELLVRTIDENDLESGRVVKANGQWFIEGEQAQVPKPVIKLPHWTEGTKAIVIEGVVEKCAG